MKRSSFVLIAALVAPVVPTVALRADEPAPVSDAAKERATVLMKEGNDLSGDGLYPEALAKFQEAYAAYPSPKILLNIGTTMRNLGRNADAAEVYETYLARGDRDPARVPELERILKEIDAVVGHITVKATVAGSKVTIDTKDLGTAPFARTIRVEPGAHKIVAEKAGMQAFVGTLTLKPGETQIAEADPLPPGVVTKTNTVTVETSRGQRIAAVIVGSAGIAAGIVGGVFGGLAMSTNDDASLHCAADHPEVCDSEGVALGSTASSQATVSTVMISVGGAALLGGIILWVTAPTRKVAPAATGTVAAALPIGVGIGPTKDGVGARARVIVRW